MARWQHDTKTGPQVVRRTGDDLLSVAADDGFQDWNTDYEIAALDIDYLMFAITNIEPLCDPRYL